MVKDTAKEQVKKLFEEYSNNGGNLMNLVDKIDAIYNSDNTEIIKMDISEERMTGLCDAFESIHRTMGVNDYAAIVINLDKAVVHAKVYQYKDIDLHYDI